MEHTKSARTKADPKVYLWQSVRLKSYNTAHFARAMMPHYLDVLRMRYCVTKVAAGYCYALAPLTHYCMRHADTCTFAIRLPAIVLRSLTIFSQFVASVDTRISVMN